MFKDIKEIKGYIKKNDVKFVDFKLVDLKGKFRHLVIPANKLTEKTMKNGIGFDGSNYGFAKVEKSDMVFYPDLASAVLDPFAYEPTITMMGNVYEIKAGKNIPFDQYPRNVINKAVEVLNNEKIADEMLIGPEYEFSLFDNVSYSNKPNNNSVKIYAEEAKWDADDDMSLGFHTPSKGGYHIDKPCDITFDVRNDMCEVMSDFGIDVKYHHHEVGGNQVEIEAELGDVRKLADDTMLAKYIIRNVAYENEMSACFLPKPVKGEAGNGMHVHMILKKKGKNVFYKKGNYASLSNEAMYFIGGLLKHINSLCAFTNPTTNSYKRLVPGFEAPVTVGYASANRSAVVRIPMYAKEEGDVRFELRNPDATCNPYFAYAAILMAGIDGIKNKINPKDYNWGPFDFNLFDLKDEEKAKLSHLPTSVDEAIEALNKDNEYLLKDGVFTKELINNWVKAIKADADAVNYTPNPAEFDMYYDL